MAKAHLPSDGDRAGCIHGPNRFRNGDPVVSAITQKKHHYVPQFILRNFANSRRQLKVMRVDRPAEYTAAVVDMLHRNNGHTKFLPGGEVDQTSVDDRMSELESAAAAIVGRLATETSAPLLVDDIATLQYFLAMQVVRHRTLMARIRASVVTDFAADGFPNNPDTDAVIDYTLVSAIEYPMDAYAARERPDDEASIRWREYQKHFGDYTWRLQRYRTPSLIVGDTLVAMSGVRTDVEVRARIGTESADLGMAGLANSRRITVPLTPKLGLLLHRSKDPASIEATTFNRSTVKNSRELVAFHPSWPGARSDLYEQVARDVEHHRAVVPAFRPPL